MVQFVEPPHVHPGTRLSLLDGAGASDHLTTVPRMFRALVSNAPHLPLVHFFGTTLSVADVDRLSSSFCDFLVSDRRTNPGDRVCVFMQNIPQYVIASLGIWKAGCVVVSTNPMYMGTELKHILLDSRAKVVVTQYELNKNVLTPLLKTFQSTVTSIVTTFCMGMSADCPAEFAQFFFADQDRHAACTSPVFVKASASVHDMGVILSENGITACERWLDVKAEDPAFLSYTSGTTGPSKGAINTHSSVVFNTLMLKHWMKLSTGHDVMLAVAPLFHITGAVNMCQSLCTGIPMVLLFRFQPMVFARESLRYKCTFTIAAITVFIALMEEENVTARHLQWFEKLYSGGAPIAANTVKAFYQQFGRYVHPIYGLTETTAPSHATPLYTLAPVDPDTGAISIGIPTHDTLSYVVNDAGEVMPAGKEGEIVISAPTVITGYWNLASETANAIRNLDIAGLGTRRWLFTGDIGFINKEGWFFTVDRKKDMIIASGFKIWPREVEDCLYTHPAVRECAVVGVPDPYQGQAIQAFVSLKQSQVDSTDLKSELATYCKERIAKYKCPKQIVFMNDLPKTQSGKILRRSLRPSVKAKL